MILFDLFDAAIFVLLTLFAVLGVVTCVVILKEGGAVHRPTVSFGPIIGLAIVIVWFVLVGVSLVW